MKTENKTSLALLFMRISIFIVMFIWTIDKFVRPEHAAQVFTHFYYIANLDSITMYTIGALEMTVLLGFLMGYQKRLTYGTVLLLHGISTLSSFKQYLAPFESAHLLFFAAWPMLAACYGLYVLRDLDILWTIGKKPSSPSPALSPA